MIGLDDEVVKAMLSHNDDMTYGTQFYHQAQKDHPHLAAFFLDQAKAIEDVIMEDDPDTTMKLTTQYAVAGDAAGYALLDALALLYALVKQTVSKEHEAFPEVTTEELEIALDYFGRDVPHRVQKYLRFMKTNNSISPNVGNALEGLTERSGLVFDKRCDRKNPVYEQSRFITTEGTRTTLCALQYTLFYAPMFKGMFREYLKKAIS